MTVAAQAAEPLRLRAGDAEVWLSADHGALVRCAPAAATGTLARSGADGLWTARFQDGRVVRAADFQPGPDAGRRFTATPANGALRLTYTAPELRVDILATPGADGLDLTATLEPATNAVLDFALPARLWFDPARVTRFVAPLTPHQGVGAALNRRFFEPRPPDQPAGWQPLAVGGAPYARLAPDGLVMRDLREPAIALRATDEGRAWLGAALAERCAAVAATVSRPPRGAQVTAVLLDSDHGPFLHALRLPADPDAGGRLWRFSGQFPEPAGGLAAETVAAILRKLRANGAARPRLALVEACNGPSAGAFANLPVAAWRRALEALAPALGARCVCLPTPAALRAALATNDCLAIVNPYGEWLPAADGAELVATADAIGAYVRRGGHWFETGGYSLHTALQPQPWLRGGGDYPPVFADFLRLETTAGCLSLFRVQPRTWAPWAATRNPAAVCVPGRLAYGGAAEGGWCERAFGTYVPAGRRWQAPVVRLRFGQPLEDDLRHYRSANGLTARLADKLAPALLERLRQAVLIKFNGPARDKLAALDSLPVPALLHDADYLKGGFDKEYPDHLPPHPSFGTADDLRTYQQRARERGHLVMPYTNPTWWCDDPPGPTFQAAGRAPLLRQLDGTPLRERYGRNEGWTICYWHPAVQAANRRTRTQFRDTFPVDVLFQDQCGARGWHYDTNPAAPAPHAYVEGLLSMLAEDATYLPLSTEDGWDRVANVAVQLCGFTFALCPEPRAIAVTGFKSLYPPDTATLYPFVQQCAHEQALLLHHDLGKFVMDQPTLAWTLGLGFGLSYVTSANELRDPARQAWLAWLAVLQKTVCARSAGAPAGAFAHTPGSPRSHDDGGLRAVYGEVTVHANLGDTPRGVEGVALAPYGFRADAPGLVAAGGAAPTAADSVAVRAEAGDTLTVWLYGAPGQAAAVPLPEPVPARLEVRFDTGAVLPAVAVDAGTARFRLPEAASGTPSLRRVWHATARPAATP